MKKLLVIALALFTLNGVAQEKRKKQGDRKQGSELRKEMTPSEVADLKAKKMTLKLDLTDAQQNKVHTIFLNQAKVNDELRKGRKAAKGMKKEKPSKDEFVKMQNQKLDQQINIKRFEKN
jgi:protein CpxP